jgi:hypothetical protein
MTEDMQTVFAVSRAISPPPSTAPIPYTAVPPGPVLATGAGAARSAIDGEYHGWEGETVYPLRDGSVWRQANYYYHYHYAYSPQVLLYSDGGVTKMHVIGDDGNDVAVQRLR